MSLLEQHSFIKGIIPFDSLKKSVIERIAQALDIEYFKKDELLIERDKEAQYLYFIIKGAVLEKNGDEVVSLYADNEFFDPITLVEKRAKHDFICSNETICYLLPKDIFLQVMYENRELESYFFQSIAQKLGANINRNSNSELVNFMVARVKDAYLEEAAIVHEQKSIYECVAMMKEQKLGALLVRCEDDEYAIVTDTDFREKVILQRLDFDTAIGQIATRGLRYVNENEFLFNAQLQMTKYGIKRLIVKDKSGEIKGILSQISLVSFFASHTYALSNEIERARTIAELQKPGKNFVRIVKALYAKGVKVRYISKLLSELNKKLFQKVFDLIAPKGLGESSCLVVMGSEGRGEQIMRTDQDNALIIADDCPVEMRLIEAFTQRFTRILLDFGYPECPGNIMLSNPYWRKNVKTYKHELQEYMDRGDEQSMMYLAIFFDATAVAGKEELLIELKRHTFKTAKTFPQFYSRFAKVALSFETPLGFFNDFIVDKNEHKNELDIKKGGIFPIVHGIRSLSLEYGISPTNSVDRIKELNNKTIIDKEMAGELIEAFNFFLTMRLKSRLEKMEQGIDTDNYINPGNLSKLEKDMLKDSFKVVNGFKKFLNYHYKLNYV